MQTLRLKFLVESAVGSDFKLSLTHTGSVLWELCMRQTSVLVSERWLSTGVYSCRKGLIAFLPAAEQIENPDQ